jgi:type I restriction-modification system DNA methylase subunit
VPLLCRSNTRPWTSKSSKGDPDNIAQHLVSYIKGFSKNIRDIFEFFEFENEIEKMREAAKLFVYGQDDNKRAFATAASDMLMKQVDHNGGGDNIRFGDSFTDDRFKDPPLDRFDYFLTNPPFGVDWKKQQNEIEREHDKLGFAGRFGAGSGESDIRKWIIENDWLEAIVALPEQMFYNTGSGTYRRTPLDTRRARAIRNCVEAV